MPQPAANDTAAQRLIDVYQEAQEALVAEYRTAIEDPRRVRQTRRLRELIDSHQTTMASLREQSRTWWSTELPALHAAGAAESAVVTGSSFAWTQVHIDAVNEYVTRTWDDVAKSLDGISDSTRAALRREVSAGTRSVLLEGRTATQAGRELAQAAAREGLWSVRYSNGAYHTMADYFDSVIRTTTAEAYNRGSVVQTAADGFTHVEYFDGPDCGVTSHNDPQKANGLIVPIEDVVYISHPRCRRAVLPALETGPLTSGVDIGTERAPETPAAPARAPRTPRQPRTPRSPR